VNQEYQKEAVKSQRGTGERKDPEPSVIAPDSRPHIETGEYSAICYKVEYGWCFGRRTLYICFRIQGSLYDGAELFMPCACPKGKLTPRMKIYEQWSMALGKSPHPKERLNIKVFKNKIYRIIVRDSQAKFSNGTLKPAFRQYSVVDTILSVEAGVQESDEDYPE